MLAEVRILIVVTSNRGGITCPVQRKLVFPVDDKS